ncbi:MAG: hypothetical protein JWM59_4277 [Verrucomicrobiales bacterium]|nr:hypothetical protein [Verrucomicrobiales bacterium]
MPQCRCTLLVLRLIDRKAQTQEARRFILNCTVSRKALRSTLRPQGSGGRLNNKSSGHGGQNNTVHEFRL